MNINLHETRRQFVNPDHAFRTAPLWVWNDLMTEDLIDRQLQELHQHGFGGAFVHPRPGLVTEYLSEEWFDRWTFALETAKQLGMKLYIYDENSYPSGFAGGHVPALLPDCLATSVTYRIEPIQKCSDDATAPILNDNDPFLRAYAVIVADDDHREPERIVCDLSDIPQEDWHLHGEWCMRIYMLQPQTMSWLGGFAYVDMMRPEVTETFLQTTYEAYLARFGSDFGSHIPAIFTDEPAVTGSRIYTVLNNQLPFSYWFASEFMRRRKYSLLEHLPALFKNVSCDHFVRDAEKVRFDYYCTVRELWIENSIQPIAAWCEQHNIAWTGHFMEHYWPLAGGLMVSPSIMSAYEYFQWPAIDLLLGSSLQDKPVDDMIVIMMEVQSVANQLGKERVLCETYGASGWDSTFADYKRMADWLLVNGINFINQHYSLTTTTGARKRDHPPSFDGRQPWWPDYTELNDYVARASYMLAGGRMKQRMLVLHPTTSGYLVPIEDENADLMAGRPPLNPDMRSYLQLLQTLRTEQWDFDLGDEWIMQRHARVHGKRIEIGDQRYDVIIVSGDMRNMLASTLGLLQQFLDAGGVVLACGMPGPYVDGEARPQIYANLAAMNGYRMMKDVQSVNSELEHLAGKRIHSSSPWKPGVAHMRRELGDDCSLYFFVNHSHDAFETFIELEGERIERWDLWTGKQFPVQTEPAAHGIGFRLRLHHNESCLLLVYDREGTGEEAVEERQAESAGGNADESLLDTATATAIAGQPQTHPVTTIATAISSPALDASSGGETDEVQLAVKDWRIWPEEANVLALDYCDLFVDGSVYRDMYAPRAGQLLFQLRGFDDNPWDNAIQYRRRILDRDTFDEQSGFTISYQFEVAGDVPEEPLYFIAERADDYSIHVNGHTAAWEDGASWLDHHNGATNIRPWLQQGLNTVTLTASRFHVGLEVEPAYVRGNFSVVASVEDTWLVRGPGQVGWGDWVTQGYPFYPGAFRYTCTVDVPVLSAGQAVLIELPEQLESTACSLFIDGQRVGLIGLDDGGRMEITAYLLPGSHTIMLRVCGGYKNLLGPHHDPSRERRSAWPAMWKKSPKFGKPPASQYDLIRYGLAEPFKLLIRGR